VSRNAIERERGPLRTVGREGASPRSPARSMTALERDGLVTVHGHLDITV
jgi:hypothetical protein